jgi:uncharacterized membrane protein YoaK (UPF0700 family)
MTGNMVLLGVAVGRGELSALEHTGLAVASFIIGTAAGALLAVRVPPAAPVVPLLVLTAVIAVAEVKIVR